MAIESILGALVYFCDPEDLIPDNIPGLGYLDDAIYNTRPAGFPSTWKNPFNPANPSSWRQWCRC